MGTNDNYFTNKTFENKEENKNAQNRDKNFVGGAVILGVSTVAAVIAGAVTTFVSKKKSEELLKDLGKEPLPKPVVLENPYSLAFRALAWGTVWAVGGVTVLFYAIWKYTGFKDLEELRQFSRKHIRGSKPSEGRTEFESLSDFLNYLNETSKKSNTKTDDTKSS